MVCKLSLLFLSLHAVNTVKHDYNTLGFIPQLYWLKTIIILDVIFEVSTIFIRSFMCQISYSNLWVDICFQTSAQTLFLIRLKTISLKFSSSIFPVITQYSYIYIFLCSGATIKRIARTQILLVREVM